MGALTVLSFSLAGLAVYEWIRADDATRRAADAEAALERACHALAHAHARLDSANALLRLSPDERNWETNRVRAYFRSDN